MMTGVVFRWASISRLEMLPHLESSTYPDPGEPSQSMAMTNMGVDMVVDMEVDMVANMEVDTILTRSHNYWK